MSTHGAALTAATAILAAAAVGCGDLPTNPADGPVDSGFMAEHDWSNAQGRITLCHRTSAGAFSIITVADAAYDTHMEHGDRQASVNDLCPTDELISVQLVVEAGGPGPVSLTFGELAQPHSALPSCAVGESCEYFVPINSTVTLNAIGYTFGYKYVAWGGYPSTGSCADLCDIHLWQGVSDLVITATEPIVW